LKGKSYSASKLKPGQMKYSTESKEGSREYGNRELMKGLIEREGEKEKRKDLNLFIENGLKKGR
jgi:hypothetical protein